MSKTNVFISMIIFSFLFGVTSVIKTQSRVIEKNIYKTERKIKAIRTDLSETELDYSYLSSPNNLTKIIEDLSFVEYVPMDFTKIYMSFKDFMEAQKK